MTTGKRPRRDTRPKSRKIRRKSVSWAASSVLADLYLFEFIICLGERSRTAVCRRTEWRRGSPLEYPVFWVINFISQEYPSIYPSLLFERGRSEVNGCGIVICHIGAEAWHAPGVMPYSKFLAKLLVQRQQARRVSVLACAFSQSFQLSPFL